jgi:hypothetical protein
MSNKEPIEIYTQDDMDTVLAATRKFEEENASLKRENELTHQLLWAVVEAAGGRVAVPYETWSTGGASRQLAIQDDPITYEMVLQVVIPENPEPECPQVVFTKKRR